MEELKSEFELAEDIHEVLGCSAQKQKIVFEDLHKSFQIEASIDYFLTPEQKPLLKELEFELKIGSREILNEIEKEWLKKGFRKELRQKYTQLMKFQ